MTSVPDSTASTTRSAGSAPLSRRTGGWWGVAFVVLLLLSESAVALPLSSHTTGFIAEYYERHRWVITVCQVAQLVAAWVLWRFVAVLADSVPAPARARTVRWSGLGVCLASVLTSVPVLTLALVPGLDAGTTRVVAGLTDSSDVLLLATVAVFAVACGRAIRSAWVRGAATVVAGIALARVVIGATGHAALGAVAPVAFLAFVLALAIRMVLGRGAR